MTSVNGQVSPAIKNKRKVVVVVLLSGETLVVHVDVKAKLYEVFNQVASQLSLRETEYFGLAIVRDDEYQFLILDQKISKVAPKRWKSGPGEGLDTDNKPLLTLWFRVQFYVDQVVLLREKVTRHLYYLQLKENVLKYNHLYNEEKCFQLVGCALQADFGNFIPEKHTAGYFDPRQYFPAWMVEKRGVDYLRDNGPLIHHDMHNVTRTDAELKYIRECSTSPGAHNLHFYRVRKKKTDKLCNTWLAICARGVEVYEDDAGFKNLISTFLWPDIGKLYFDKKKFEIRSVGSAGGRRFTYYTENDTTSKYMLHICRSTHMFQMAIQPKLIEIRHLDAEDKKRYRESYIYSDARDLVANGGLIQYRGNRSPGKSPAGTQRYSVISDASSNTTSGIVSDKMAISFEDGEEHSKEIIIDCPPRQSLHGTPGQMRTKMQLIGSYKKTPPTPGNRSPALPPQSLELYRTTGSSGKTSPASSHTQELSPISNSGSYRAKLQQTSHALYGPGGKSQSYVLTSSSSPGQTYVFPTPSPSSPRENSFTCVTRSASRKESFKGLQGPMLVPLERNVSGDSTGTSSSTASAGLASLSVENSPVTQPAHLGMGVGAASTVPYPNLAGSPKYSYGCHAASSFPQPVPPPHAHLMNNGLMYQVDKSPTLNAGIVLQPLMARLTVQDASPPLHHLQTRPTEHLYTDRSEAKVQEGQEGPVHTKATDIILTMATFKQGDQNQAYTLPYNLASGNGNHHIQLHGDSTDSGNVLSDESSSAHHSAQSSEEDSGVKENYSDSSTSRKGTSKTVSHKLAGRTLSGTGKPTHVSVKNQKEALHPELEQILGQPHGHSLPLITALCNDLMTGSGHSSLGSYDTATLCSSDSHSTPLSGETETRRWSTCGPAELGLDGSESGCGSTGTMLVVGGGGSGSRPYSWHSEHFDLETSLRVMPYTKIKATPHLLQRNHQNLQPLENHRSVPQNLGALSCANGGTSVLWTQAVANGNSPCGGSLDRYSPDLVTQHLMIPSRLTSGGHSGTDGNISHHKALKETIGIA